MSVKSSVFKTFACSLFFGLFCSTLAAQSYPDRPIKMIVPFAPGGPNDLVARIIAPPLGEALKQTIIIENKAGAGGNIGTAFVAKSKPDGYTLLLTTSSVAANMILYKDTGYDLEKEFIGIVNMASAPNIYCVPKDSVIMSMQDLLTNPKYTKINYASPGTGSTAHLGMAYLFKKSSKVDAVHIPYKGGAPAMNAAMASEVDVASAALPAAYTFVKANKIRALAVSSKNRLPHLPEVPTLTELGYPNQEITTWAGIFSPQNTPADITSRINNEMNKILQNPQIKEKLLNSGFIVEGGSIQSFKETIHQELEFWKTVVQVTGSNLQ
jgi:tripartite-type tricarboxylate transporter receptor subunit TctC